MISPDPKSLLIKVFGSPTVVRDGREVTGAGTQRRRLALLAVLAVGAPPGRAGVSRERLLELLWPGAGEERGRAALSQALYAIRRDLGRDDAITGTSALRLNADCVRCDLWDFLAAIADGADREGAELRTAPLLDGFDLPEASAFEFWMEEQRQEIDRSWRLAVDRAARAAEQTGDLTAMVRWRRALANADPLSGRTAVALARSLDAAGEREAALRHLKVHMALVRQELEGEPHAEVVQLAEELQRAGRPAPSPAPVALLAPAAPALALPPAPPADRACRRTVEGRRRMALGAGGHRGHPDACVRRLARQSASLAAGGGRRNRRRHRPRGRGRRDRR